MTLGEHRIAEWAIRFGKLAWIALLLTMTVLAANDVLRRRAEEAQREHEAARKPSARDNVPGFSMGAQRVTNMPYMGPIYQSNWRIDEATGKLVRVP